MSEKKTILGREVIETADAVTLEFLGAESTDWLQRLNNRPGIVSMPASARLVWLVPKADLPKEKAKPGVKYVGKNGYSYVGRVDGRVELIDSYGYRDFDSSLFTEVE